MSMRLTSKPFPIAGLLFLPLLQAPGALAVDTTPDVIRRLEEQLNSALVQCDSVGLDRLWDDHLVFVFPSGSVATKTERLAGLKQCTPGSPTSTNESVEVRVYGDAAVAIVVSKWSGLAGDKPFASRFRATHVWAKRGDRWTLVAAHVSQLKE